MAKMSAWKIIAKTELRRKTSGFRGHRMVVFTIIYILLLLWAFLGAPYLFNLFMPSLVSNYPLIAVPLIAVIIEFLMMMLFLLIIMYPMQNIYRKMEMGYKEMVLASPATAGDIFIGEFVGKIPIYLIFVLIFSPIIVGLINPILNLDLIQNIVIYSAITGHILFAALLGSIIVAWLEHKIAKSEKARDLGKVLLFVLAIGLVVIMYSLMFLFTFLIENPQIKNYIMIYPSLWFSNIILYSIQPTLISAYILNIWISIILSITIPFLVLFISYRKAHVFFSLELSIEKNTIFIEKENIFYKFIRKFTGSKWEGLIITQFKEFFRKRENIMKIVYSTGLTLFEGVIFAFLGGDYPNLDIRDITMFMLLSIMIAGMLFSLFLGNYIFIGSKELLWVYKKSPRNIKSLIFSYLRMVFILIFLIAIGLNLFFSLFYQYNLFSSIYFFILFIVYGFISLSQAIGIQCINPTFEEKGGDMTLNVGILIIINMATMFGSIFLGIIMLDNLNPPAELIKIYLSIPLLVISLMITIPLLLYGLKRINRIE